MNQNQQSQSEQSVPKGDVYRDLPERKLLGVAAALSRTFRMPVAIVRLVFFILTFFHGLGIALYLAGYAFLPECKGENSLAEKIAEGVKGFADGFRGQNGRANRDHSN